MKKPLRNVVCVNLYSSTVLNTGQVNNFSSVFRLCEYFLEPNTLLYIHRRKRGHNSNLAPLQNQSLIVADQVFSKSEAF